jgi:hypothetical protein
MRIHFISVCLRGVYLTGMCLIGLYLMGVYLMYLTRVYVRGIHLISIHLIGVHHRIQPFLLSRTYVFAAFGGRWLGVAFLFLAQLGTRPIALGQVTSAIKDA